MKKKLLLAPLMAVLVACVVVLSGCGGPSVEELITEDLTTQFDEVKNGGDDFLSGLESMNKIVEDFSTQYQEKVAALDTVPSDDELYKMAGQVMVDVTKATEPRKTTVIFKYTCNDDGEWSADDSVNSEMMDAMLS